MPHKEGIEAVKQMLTSQGHLRLILKLNNFVFNDIKKGCAMVTKCGPSYANIFMVWFMENLIFLLLTNLSNFYPRFIDNIFLTWNGAKNEFDNFLKNNQ